MMFTLPRLMVCTLDLVNPCHSTVHPRMAEVPPLATAVGLMVCNRRFLDRLGYDYIEETANPAYQMFLGR